MMASKKEEPIIEVKNLSKQYNIGVDTTYKTLSESVTSAVRHPIKALKDFSSQNETFWALKDVNFEVERGEVIGIIGRNGAGKSTLLKILSRITSPTEGEVRMRGRVGSLLEVGTGFHPELSGRENIYFNGSILGMKKREIDEKFDEIVKFSGVEKFLDTPVKRYSSGMQVRLAFSVAANLDPEILVVDEVLAVGDAAFQKKCLGKMEEVAEGGRTVLFVSHNMSMISSLCETAILLEKGTVIEKGKTGKVINAYLNSGQEATGQIIFSKNHPGDSEAILLAVRVLNKDGMPITEALIDEDIFIEMEYKLLKNDMLVYPNFHIYDQYGQVVFVTSDSKLDHSCELKNKAGDYVSRCKIPANTLNNNTYYITFALTTIYPLHVHFCEKDLLFVTINDPIEGIYSRSKGYSGPMPGAVRPLLEWKLYGPKDSRLGDKT
ncbi:ABC transporter ATP-binding protein [Methanosarcina sp. UBA5]|uniref:ABC transporter ATP-binding protein n=1 Tax=Methanosarcina sp. UBA5 TaxID=1915593 RepID=UPI0025FF58D9|nr:ABC transporter ATP-binding protein [Methanosarcina sp. UBA5]